MWKRYMFGLSVFALFVFAIMGCQMTPGEKFPVKVRGVVANPDNTCYLDFVANPDITEGLPLPNADLTIVGDQGSRLTARTDAQGVFEFWGKAGEAYVVYAQKGDIRVKKGITTLVSSSDTGEANYFTTAQVIIWEVAEELYPGALPMKDIHLIQPTDALVQAVKAVLADCKDAQGDPGVRALAEALVNTLFGAPGVFEGPAGGGTPATTPTPTAPPTPTTPPTPTVTPTTPPAPTGPPKPPTPPPCPACG
jgi:hypothetical protein